jgi:hypothetical protein
MDERTARTPEKEAKVLRRLALGYSVSSACQFARIGRTSYYQWRKDDPAFALAADAAIEEGTDRLEDEAMRRAMQRKEPSDTLLIFLLKGRRPEKFRDNATVRHEGSDGGPLTVTVIRHVAPLEAE